MTKEEKGDKKLLDDDYYWNSFYTAHYNAGWRSLFSKGERLIGWSISGMTHTVAEATIT